MPRGFGERTASYSITMSQAELAALFPMTGTSSARRSSEMLGLEIWSASEDINAAGFESLLQRGLAAADERGARPLGAARAICLVAGEAHRWEVVTVSLSDIAEAWSIYTITSEAGSVAFSLSGTGVHEARPLRAGIEPFQLPREVLTRQIARGDHPLPYRIFVHSASLADDVICDVTLERDERIVWSDGHQQPLNDFWSTLTSLESDRFERVTHDESSQPSP